MIPRILSIAGSDSGGGAGIQADVKTITMLGGHAMTAVTALTAQNTLGVVEVMTVPAAMVRAQIAACADDIGVDAVKIGMLGSAEVAETVADMLAPSPLQGRGSGRGGDVRGWGGASPYPTPPLPTLSPEGERAMPVVLDPVMIATSGAALADAATIAALDRLMGLATLVTPNLPELAALTSRAIATPDDLAAAAHVLADRTGAAVLAKGGHLPGDELVDVLVTSAGERRWRSTRIASRHTHGTGCTLSSAIACHLGAGLALEEAVDRARAFVRAAILAAPGLGRGHGPMGHGLVARD